MSVNLSKSSECSASSSTKAAPTRGTGDNHYTSSLHGSIQKKKTPRAPLSKLTPRTPMPHKSLRQIKLCLDTYHTPKNTPARQTAKKLCVKALSMEDLTPTKRVKIESKASKATVVAAVAADGECDAGAGGGGSASRRRRAAAAVCRFMVLSAWRRRRDEVRCLRKTLEYQVTCSEKLRIQTWTLKSLLDSDNRKVQTALRELKRLKQLLHDKEQERLVLDTEKRALEEDVVAEQDRASELQIGWHNCRNALEGAHGALAASEAGLAAERLAAAAVRAHRDCALQQVSCAEAEAVRVSVLLARVEREAAALREETLAKEQLLEVTLEQLDKETMLRARAETERATLSGRVSDNALEMGILKLKVCELQAELERVATELVRTRAQLDWWPRPLTKLLGAARSWLRGPVSLQDALLWSLLPARHGC